MVEKRGSKGLGSEFWLYCCSDLRSDDLWIDFRIGRGLLWRYGLAMRKSFTSFDLMIFFGSGLGVGIAIGGLLVRWSHGL